MFQKIKEKSDSFVIQKIKGSVIKASEENGIQIHEILTPSVEKKFDELLHTILQEHGYKKLAGFGLKKIW